MPTIFKDLSLQLKICHNINLGLNPPTGNLFFFSNKYVTLSVVLSVCPFEILRHFRNHEEKDLSMAMLRRMTGETRNR